MALKPSEQNVGSEGRMAPRRDVSWVSRPSYRSRTYSNLMSFYSQDGPPLDRQESGTMSPRPLTRPTTRNDTVPVPAIVVEDDKSETAVSRGSSQDDNFVIAREEPRTPGPVPSTKESIPTEPQLYGFEKLAQKHPGPWEHTSMTIGPPIIILLDIVVPCIIYYVWYGHQVNARNAQCTTQYPGQVCPLPPAKQYDEEILGYAVISFGLGEVYILLARVWRLWNERDICAPLLSRSRWELDATSWVYLVAMIVALIPFVVGASLELEHLYLYGPSFLMGFLGAIMIITMLPFPIPIGINSHARGSALRPFIYYAAEDFIAVDGLQDREFRVRYNARYDTDRNFRLMFLELTIWWIFGVLVYIGCVSAVIWKLEFHYAFGTSLGVLFAYIISWAGVSVFWVKLRMHQMKKARMGIIHNQV